MRRTPAIQLAGDALIRRALPGRLARRGASGEPDASMRARVMWAPAVQARASMQSDHRTTHRTSRGGAQRLVAFAGLVSIALGVVMSVSVATSSAANSFPEAFAHESGENTYTASDNLTA